MTPEQITQGVCAFAETELALSFGTAMPYQGPGVRPSAAYISVEVVSDANNWTDATTVPSGDDDGTIAERTSSHRRSTISLNTYGASADAWATQLAVAWNSRRTSAEALRTAGFHPETVSGPRNLSRVVDTGWEPRRQLTLTGYHRHTLDDQDVSNVETIDATLNIGGVSTTVSVPEDSP